MNPESVQREATDYLQQLLRIDTTSPPGNEMAAIRWLDAILQKEGLRTTIVEGAPGRANLVCRLATGGTEGPLLLSSHVDVVPAESPHWTHPPFGGVIADGCIWGRGAIDMKSMTIYGLMAMLRAKREGWRTRRDIIFAAVADEEIETKYGSAYLVTHHPDLIRAEYGLNEVGGFTIHVNGHRLYPVEVAQKGLVWLAIHAHGTPGHGSTPHSDLAAKKIAHALTQLTHHRLRFHRTPAAAEFVKALASLSAAPRKWLLRGLTLPGLGQVAARLLPHNADTAFLLATLHNTACPTALRGGSDVAINVIPSTATMYVDGRLLPGQTKETFLAELQSLLGKGYDYEILKYREPTEQPIHTPLFDTIDSVVREADPGAHITPYLIAGFDDAHFYKKIGITMYGFQPLKCPPDYHAGRMYHAHNERIPLDGFHWGVHTFAEVVRRFVC